MAVFWAIGIEHLDSKDSPRVPAAELGGFLDRAATNLYFPLSCVKGMGLAVLAQSCSERPRLRHFGLARSIGAW